MKIQFPVGVSAKTYSSPYVILNSCVGGPSKCLKENVSFPHKTFLEFPESVRMRSVDSCGTESISVVVITIWLVVITIWLRVVA